MKAFKKYSVFVRKFHQLFESSEESILQKILYKILRLRVQRKYIVCEYSILWCMCIYKIYMCLYRHSPHAFHTYLLVLILPQVRNFGYTSVPFSPRYHDL